VSALPSLTSKNDAIDLHRLHLALSDHIEVVGGWQKKLLKDNVVKLKAIEGDKQ